MLCVSAHTHEHIPYSATLYPTSFTLESLLALTIRARHKTHGWCFTSGLMACGFFFLRDCTFWDCKGGVLIINRQQVGPLVNTPATTTATGINHVDSGRFSSRCCTFRRTHTSADPIRILCIRLALTLTLSRPPGFASCARLMVCASTWALQLVVDFSCDCMFWDDRGGGLAGQLGP